MRSVEEYIGPRPNPLGNWFWGAVSAGFLILLGWQVQHFMGEKYLQHESFRHYLAGFCEIASCQLPPRRDPSRFTLTHTRIDLHPNAPGALRISVKLVNEATFAQPYPDLQLTLTDRNGRVVGRRAFPPGQYLGKEPPGTLASGELGVVQLDLANPHEQAVGFAVDIVTRPVSS